MCYVRCVSYVFVLLIIYVRMLVYANFVFFCYLIFFFNQNTAYGMRISYWSSDVCSSDLHKIFKYLKGLVAKKLYIGGSCLDYFVVLWPRADNHQLLVRHTCKGAYDEVHFFIRHHTRSGKVKIFFVGAKRKVIYRHARDRKSTRLNSSH